MNENDSKNLNNPTKEILLKPGIYNPDQPGSTTPNNPATTTTSTTTLPPTIGTIFLPSGAYGSFGDAMKNVALPESLSSARWSDNAPGFPQQTFLGASIRSFTMNGGFGDNSSSLTVELVVDEYNISDKTPVGQGDDIYHNGVADKFVPPIPGSPVFFKFGPNLASIEEAYRKTFDDLYFYQTIPNIQPSVGGGAALSAIVEGKAALPPNSYYDLNLKDFTTPLTSGTIRPLKDYSAIRNNPLTKGMNHITFGGILQTYTQNRGPNGNPLYTVQVIDPREILSNATLILNDYGGPIHDLSNLINVYGFLEYELSDAGKQQVSGALPFASILNKQTTLTQNGADIKLQGTDKYYKSQPPEALINDLREQIEDLEDQISGEKRKITDYRIKGDNAGADASYNQMVKWSNDLIQLKVKLQTTQNQAQPSFPITGTGYSRRSAQGIPYYRIKDAVTALSEYNMPLPEEYKKQGFGGKINFRGFNYAVDFSGLPELPEFYYVDFDQISLLELAQEICDVTNRDLFVSLLPIINHPACANLYTINQSSSSENLIAGIIRIDTVDRSEQPFYGAVKTYIDSLASQGIYVENQDLGYELSNISTDKFVVGAQECELHYFSANADKDNIAFRITGQNGIYPNKPAGYEWSLEAALEQQVLPYFGKLGANAVTIPKGFGAYKQILLDSSTLQAAGVGSYYVATEMELRCALVSYEKWREFLLIYNDTYMESIELDDFFETSLATLTAAPVGTNPAVLKISDNYVVTVPRSVWDTFVLPVNGSVYGSDGLPLSPCNPPYGYPLYFKRATKIGIPEAGLTSLAGAWNRVQQSFAALTNADDTNIQAVINSQWKEFDNARQEVGLTDFEKAYFDELTSILSDPTPKPMQESIALIENMSVNRARSVATLVTGGGYTKKSVANAHKVYTFVKSVAEECLGKKFLVKIPKGVNVFYDATAIQLGQGGEYKSGPFGFRPRSTSQINESSPEFKVQLQAAKSIREGRGLNMIQDFLNPTIPTPFVGGMSANFNPISDKYEFNYSPTNLGGYYNFDLYQNTLGASNIRDLATTNFNALPPGVKMGLIPQDLTNFIDEDGRISAYVRFDHSETLTLEGFNDNDFTQQFISGPGMIPDLSNQLDNTGPSTFTSFEDTRNPVNARPPQIAFVKCTVDEKLHMPPQTKKRKVFVHGQSVKDVGKKTLPSKIYIPCSGLENGRLVPGTGCYIDSFSFYKAHFVPLPVPGSNVEILDFITHNPYLNMPGGQQLNDSNHVKSEYNTLDSNHVYAIITLPNKVYANKDSRHRDGVAQSIATERFKHYMTMDTVRGVPGFELPTPPPPSAPIARFPQLYGQPGANKDARFNAWKIMKTTIGRADFGIFDAAMNQNAPSPISPDLVALSLISKDRCYGPWISSKLDGQAYLLKNIGGKVDFIKDENLAPWNYGGYYLMNEAGSLMAEFSNSLLLFTERGGFTIPDIPKTNSLCKALIAGGPLVTNITVDVSTGGARTTYQMDLYTASFGKLQKQKADEISKISRERKKLISERNALIRKGLGKNQSRRNFLAELNILRTGNIPSLDLMGIAMVNNLSTIAVSTRRQSVQNWSSLGGGPAPGPIPENSPNIISTTQYSTGGNIMSTEAIAGAAGNMNSAMDLNAAMSHTAIADVSDLWSAASYGADPVLPSIAQRSDATTSMVWGGSPPPNTVG